MYSNVNSAYFVSLQLPDAKVRLEKLKEDAELRQKREHFKYMETLGDDLNEGEAPLLTITQRQTERALQGSTQLMQRCAEKERKPNNLPFFQSRKPINFNLTDTRTSDVNMTESGGTFENSGERKPNQPFFKSKKPFNLHVGDTKTTRSSETSINSEDLTNIAGHSHSNPTSSNKLVKLFSGSSDQKKELSASEKARREHFSRLRQAGWIIGLDGKWYKDENAEFDSDEDEPPPPP